EKTARVGIVSQVREEVKRRPKINLLKSSPELRAQLKHMGKVSRGGWFGGFQLCSFLSPKMVRSAPRGPSIPAPRSRPARRSLSLPVRWRFLLLSRYAARAGFVTQRQTFVRRCQTLLSSSGPHGVGRGLPTMGQVGQQRDSCHAAPANALPSTSRRGSTRR